MPVMFARMRRRWRPLLALAVVAALAAAAGVAVAVLTEQPGDVSNPNVEFEAEEAPTTAPVEQRPRTTAATRRSRDRIDVAQLRAHARSGPIFSR